MARSAPTENAGWPTSVAEFEAWHCLQPGRWEFVDGRPRLMAPASMPHTLIKNNIGFALRQALADRGCTALVDGPQILTEDISAIPDVMVTCAPLDLTTPVIAMPAIIVEVMSPSTAGDDHGLKWLSYRKIASLRHYMIVAQHQRLVHLHSRAGDIWRERFVSAGSITLDDPSVTLNLDAITPRPMSRRDRVLRLAGGVEKEAGVSPGPDVDPKAYSGSW